MPDFGSIAKSGWHPKGKDGGKESWRGDFKGVDQVAKWMGKGEKKTDEGERRSAVPIKSLRDPSAFAPPPKRDPYAPSPAAVRPMKQIGSSSHTQDDQPEAEDEKPRGPSLPFRANTTGLKTDHLPPPPGRKDGADGRKATAGVEVLTTANFDQVVFNSQGKPTLVEFYSPHCIYCQQLEPVYEQLAATFLPYSNVISIAKLDVYEHKKLGARFGITSFPTIKYFNGKNGITETIDGRDLESLTTFITEKTDIRPGTKQSSAHGRPTPSLPVTKPKPGLPPRLPARQSSHRDDTPQAPPPAYSVTAIETPSTKPLLNERAATRLGAAGMNVPGFGIVAKKAVLAPPPPPRTNSTTSTQDADGNIESKPTANGGRLGGAQLSELSGRFSRMTAVPKMPDSAPKQGTSFAEKQAALKTAQSFQKDPSSISFTEARAAASTANNFRERHGDQVVAGYNSANRLNNKYGLSDKASKYGGLALGVPATSPEPQANTSVAEHQSANASLMVVKKVPPPPPKRKPAFAPAADAGEGPPPVPLMSKPKPGTNKIHSDKQGRDMLNLDLQSLWFARGIFPPPSIASLPGKRGYASSSGWSSSGGRKTHTMTAIIRHNDDLSSTKIRLIWDGNNPGLTVKADQQYIPPPRNLNSAELETYRVKYSDRVAQWCESKMNTQVGNGECWTLAYEALKAVAAEEASGGREPCMVSQSLIHGYKIYEFLPPASCQPAGGVHAAGVARGDVIQYLSAHFKHENGGQSWAGAPDHTAVVTRVQRDGTLNIVQSNSGGVKTVAIGTVNFNELVGGEIRIFRAVGESWVGPMDPSWP